MLIVYKCFLVFTDIFKAISINTKKSKKYSLDEVLSDSWIINVKYLAYISPVFGMSSSGLSFFG